MLDVSDIIGVGGKLTPGNVLAAYCHGVFPWFPHDGTDILWWSPDPRFVIDVKNVHVGRTVRKARKKLHFTVDTAFARVMQECAEMRYDNRENGGTARTNTWITPNMQSVYRALHRNGIAHSVEAWKDGELVGGLYGLGIGGVFFGSSMFTREPNASKASFAVLADLLPRYGIEQIDCQMATPTTRYLGGYYISRNGFLKDLRRLLKVPTVRGKWSLEADGTDHD